MINGLVWQYRIKKGIGFKNEYIKKENYEFINIANIYTCTLISKKLFIPLEDK